MKNKILFLITLLGYLTNTYGQDKQIARQGQISFFSYTKVENIEATNNQSLSVLDAQTGEIAVRMLMRAFTFKKALMQEHFNESYIESDLYPEGNFEGQIIDYDPSLETSQTRIIEGIFTLRGISKPLSFKANIYKDTTDDHYHIEGNVSIQIDDYEIRVPTLLKPNIAKSIKVTFKFEYTPYED